MASDTTTTLDRQMAWIRRLPGPLSEEHVAYAPGKRLTIRLQVAPRAVWQHPVVGVQTPDLARRVVGRKP